ncbi:hypothetical protein CHCC14814_0623 [Bacillus paralicheniformis]|nr:hypothetical protein CHCC14814_0623 [Bacillus paralicheniformis]
MNSDSSSIVSQSFRSFSASKAVHFLTCKKKPSKQFLDYLYILNYNRIKKAVQTAGAKIDSRLH